MMIIRLLAVLAASGCAYGGEPVLSTQRYGVVVFGQTLAQAEQALKERAPAVASKDEESCRQLQFKAYPGVSFMVEEGLVTRAESSKPIVTSIGVTVGASLAGIKQQFPAAVVEEHKYDPDGHYVIFKSKDGRSAIVMEEARGKITDVRGGLVPSVEYVEGCL